jgi:carbon-monoxide dehydrogenase medium subunit
MLLDRQPAAENISAAAEQAASGLELLGDLAASEEFRAHLVRVHARRALERAVAAAR